MDLRTTQVNLTGLLDVLGKNLYSTPFVAVRELVQNAHDSCTRRQIEDPDYEVDAARICVRIDTDRQILTITDTGAGLTADEIENYLATVGSGYTRVLREQAENTDASSEDPQVQPPSTGALIGAFGLGFLSAYVVANRVELWTCSYRQPDRAWRFLSNGGERYSIQEAPSRAIGSELILHLKPEFSDLAAITAIHSALRRYCVLLKTPIYLDDAPQPVNDLELPWRLNEAVPQARLERLQAAVVAEFETHFDALCHIDVGSTQIHAQAGARDLQGMLWIQDGATYGTSDNRNLSVFIRGMQISSDMRELLPSWAGWLGGVIESDRLTPTASREDIQRDKEWHALKAQLYESLLSGLQDIAHNDRPTWRLILSRHNESLLGAALADAKLFELLADDLRLPTSEGDLTIRAISGRSRDTIYISSGEESSSESLLFRALRMPIVRGERYGAMAFSLRYGKSRGVKSVLLGTDEGNRSVFHQSQLDLEALAKLRTLFADPHCTIELVDFEPDYLPVLELIDRDALIKSRIESEEAERRIGPAALAMARIHTAQKEANPTLKRLVNTRSKTVQRLLDLSESDAQTLSRLLVSIASLNAPAGDELNHNQLGEALQRIEASVLALIPASPTA